MNQAGQNGNASAEALDKPIWLALQGQGGI